MSAASRRSLAGRTPWLKRKDAGTLSAVSPSKGCGSTERRFGQRTQPGTYGEGHYFRGQPATGKYIEGGNPEYFRYPEYKSSQYFAGNCLDAKWLSYNFALILLKLLHLADLEKEI